MKHATATAWSSRILAEVGVPDDMAPCADALRDAPVIMLGAGEALERSRSGQFLAALALSGTLQVTEDGIVTRHGRGALPDLRRMLAETGAVPAIQAETDSVILLLDRPRVLQLAELSPRFAQRIVRDLCAVPQQRADDAARAAERCPPDSNTPLPDATGCVVLVRLANREALERCDGAAVAEVAMQSLGRAVEQSIRPGDLLLRLGADEYLVGIDGDTLAAAIVSSRLVSRAGRIVVFADMRTGLPHLDVVTGIAVAPHGETVAGAAHRARHSTVQAPHACVA
ncbi:hypothetical protein [Massilia sp. CT11-137]|uniref:hypothetical protein n=1 Tax=Massilia sp. CT11-137 TaxID=3393901 RepID=UPI0039A446AC